MEDRGSFKVWSGFVKIGREKFCMRKNVNVMILVSCFGEGIVGS